MTSDQSQVKTEELAGTLEIGSGGNLKVQDLQIPVNDAENDVKQANLLGGDFDEGSGAKKKKKRSQVKVACVGCRKACKKCDDCRPCSRCVRYNISCFDADKKPKPKKKDQRLIDQPYHLPSRRSAPVAVMENNDGFRDLGDPLPRSRFPSASSFQSIPESMLDQSHDHESTFVTDPEPNELYLLSDVCDMLLADPKRPPKTVDTVDRGLIPPSEPLVKQMIHSRPQSRLPPSFIADPYYIDPNGSESVVHYPHPHVMYHYDPNQQYPNQQYWYHQQEQYPHHPNYQ